MAGHASTMDGILQCTVSMDAKLHSGILHMFHPVDTSIYPVTSLLRCQWDR